MSVELTTGSAKQFSGFVFAGLIAAAVNWLSRLAFSSMGMSLEVAVACAYVVGMATAYVLMRRFVFEKSGRGVRQEVARFVLVNLVSIVQVWLLTIGLAYWLPQIGFSWHTESVAHAIGVASPVITSYFGHRFVTFRRTRLSERPDKTAADPGVPAQP